jgi:DNA-directed RNA polymerase specialized sigma24 family protein
MDAHAIKQRDISFAARLKQRDESVLGEIDLAYAAPLRRLLARWRGQDFGNGDIEEILDDVLWDVWLKFDSKKASVRTYYFRAGHSQLLDRLKRNSRYRALLGVARNRAGPADSQDNELPDVRLLRVERSRVNSEIMALVAQAVELLTTRRKLAFDRRFASGDNHYWAKGLAAEKGGTPQSWRKASDEARKQVGSYLLEHGVQYSEKGGRYEVVKTRNSAG